MRRVAIIDDMLPNALLLKSYVRRLPDIEAITFTDPREALGACGETAPNLVLLDYHMPQMNGVEFIRAFRRAEHLRDVPIVMITGEERKETLYEALGAGANDFLRKPVDDIELITRVRNLLELRERQIDLAKANDQLYVLATTDQLTGLKNRRFFLDRFEPEAERSCRYRRPMSVAIIDADRFKTINDTHGHDVGDEVLRALARALLEELRNVDDVGRIGGEEFAIQLPETDRSQALIACERILKRMRETKVPIDGGEVTFTVSIGLTEIELTGDSAEAALKRADRALYRAKDSGRDRCEMA